MAEFNIDEMKGNFEPVGIIFRGQEYALGRNALGLLSACELHATIEDKNGLEYMKALLEILPELLRCMCPELVLDESLETGEQMALVKVATEVLGRVSRLSFPKEEPAGDDT
jgi:hypothetical protein